MTIHYTNNGSREQIITVQTLPVSDVGLVEVGNSLLSMQLFPPHNWSSQFNIFIIKTGYPVKTQYHKDLESIELSWDHHCMPAFSSFSTVSKIWPHKLTKIYRSTTRFFIQPAFSSISETIICNQWCLLSPFVCLPTLNASYVALANERMSLLYEAANNLTDNIVFWCPPIKPLKQNYGYIGS